ncbi:hypothetical protein BK658_00795 [Pseudomonas brassicacearum]|uniref:Recombinase domain-containing protein n=2 Tax=Pseudomonas brassicacearum TaxID=930166 RepID=A0A423H2C9_9PSED|nr:hypothetical protein BK658_00795 [Pseudomonas brassicacearum]
MVAKWLQLHPDYLLSSLTYQDLGRSGYNGAHLQGELGQLLVGIKEGLIQKGDCILVEAVDRVGRLPAPKMLSIFTEIVGAGVSVITLDDGQEYDEQSLNNNLLFLLVAKVLQAHQYSETLSRRINASYEKRRREASEGKGVKRQTPMWLTTDGQLREEIAPFVKLAFEDYASGLGERRICHRIRAGGHPELSNINGTTVKRWLRNRTAAGYWNDIPNVYPAVVDKELWFRVQSRLNGNAPKAAAPTKYLLTGLVKCGSCGRNFNVQKKQAGTGAVMQCTSRARLTSDGCENNRSIPKQVLEWVRVETSIAFVQEGLQRQHLSASQKRLVEVQGELEELSKSMNTLVDTLAEVGLIPEVQKKLQELKQQRESLESECTLLERTASPDTLTDIHNLEHDLITNDVLKLNALLQSVDYTITCYRDGLITVSGETYPYKYLGVSRKRRAYRILFLGEEHSLKIVTREQLDALREEGLLPPIPHKIEHGDGPDVLTLLISQNRRKNSIY